ncbi:UNVERIFIED_CONTAM: hypothetical protein Sradi_6994500, partial [Sesamum radiatum]
LLGVISVRSLTSLSLSGSGMCNVAVVRYVPSMSGVHRDCKELIQALWNHEANGTVISTKSFPRMRRQAMFPQCRVSTEVAKGSDHSPFIINLVANVNQDDGRRKKLFHFEAVWTRSTDCEELIQALWNHEADGTAVSRILQRQHKVREGLIGWDKSNFGHVRRRVKELEEQLVKLDIDPISVEGRLLRGQLRNELEEFLSREELMWKQRGKAQWLRKGDRNTPFFHARASAWRCKNSIALLRHGDGELFQGRHSACNLHLFS